ncbi:CLUMA_CG006653, isoform A [Clunio marinus]|uniref:CLUMA_CG006653, isoform A n=1 Tax=Clunio marinus TaxID=568069 RepID=A0A1J1I3W9_9DIPT|nr:CLUMA_CG006653, isoform A [Clunio marinus]
MSHDLTAIFLYVHSEDKLQRKEKIPTTKPPVSIFSVEIELQIDTQWEQRYVCYSVADLRAVVLVAN